MRPRNKSSIALSCRRSRRSGLCRVCGVGHRDPPWSRASRRSSARKIGHGLQFCPLFHPHHQRTLDGVIGRAPGETGQPAAFRRCDAPGGDIHLSAQRTLQIRSNGKKRTSTASPVSRANARRNWISLPQASPFSTHATGANAVYAPTVRMPGERVVSAPIALPSPAGGSIAGELAEEGSQGWEDS